MQKNADRNNSDYGHFIRNVLNVFMIRLYIIKLFLNVLSYYISHLVVLKILSFITYNYDIFQPLILIFCQIEGLFDPMLYFCCVKYVPTVLVKGFGFSIIRLFCI